MKVLWYSLFVFFLVGVSGVNGAVYFIDVPGGSGGGSNVSAGVCGGGNASHVFVTQNVTSSGPECVLVARNPGDGGSGVPGVNGSDGIGINQTLVLVNGSLQITYSNGSVAVLANITGARGATGPAGINGTNGTNSNANGTDVSYRVATFNNLTVTNRTYMNISYVQTLTLGDNLAVIDGGTGLGGGPTGGLLVMSGPISMGFVSPVTAGYPLVSQGSSSVPVYDVLGPIALSSTKGVYDINVVGLNCTLGCYAQTSTGTKYFHWNSTTQSVGIGTNAPVQKLEIVGNVNVTQNLTVGKDIELQANQSIFVGGYPYLRSPIRNSVFIGAEAGGNNSGQALGVIAIGDVAGFALTTGTNNVLIGRGAGIAMTTGSHNFALGTFSLFRCLTCGFNVAIGNSALAGLESGNGNIAFGYQAGYAQGGNTQHNITNGQRNFFAGTQSGPAGPLTSLTDAGCIGYQCGIAQNDSFNFGFTYTGIDKQNPQVALDVNGSVSRGGLYYAHQTTAPTTLTGATFTTLDLDDVEIADTAVYSESAGTVTILQGGIFDISVASDSVLKGATREFAQVALFINGTQEADVTCSMYGREVGGISGTGCEKSALKRLATGATITVRFYPDTANIDPANSASSLKMEYVQA